MDRHRSRSDQLQLGRCLSNLPTRPSNSPLSQLTAGFGTPLDLDMHGVSGTVACPIAAASNNGRPTRVTVCEGRPAHGTEALHAVRAGASVVRHASSRSSDACLDLDFAVYVVTSRRDAPPPAGSLAAYVRRIVNPFETLRQDLTSTALDTARAAATCAPTWDFRRERKQGSGKQFVARPGPARTLHRRIM